MDVGKAPALCTTQSDSELVGAGANQSSDAVCSSCTPGTYSNTTGGTSARRKRACAHRTRRKELDPSASHEIGLACVARATGRQIRAKVASSASQTMRHRIPLSAVAWPEALACTRERKAILASCRLPMRVTPAPLGRRLSVQGFVLPSRIVRRRRYGRRTLRAHARARCKFGRCQPYALCRLCACVGLRGRGWGYAVVGRTSCGRTQAHATRVARVSAAKMLQVLNALSAGAGATRSSDAVCLPCRPGTYSNTTGQSAARSNAKAASSGLQRAAVCVGYMLKMFDCKRSRGWELRSENSP